MVSISPTSPAPLGPVFATEPAAGTRRATALAAAREAVATLDAMQPLDRAERRAADGAPPSQRRGEAAEFFTDLLDADDDGKVGRDDFVAVAKELFGRDMAERLFERMDRDRDGILGNEEMQRDLEKGDGSLAEMFRRLFDWDRDGSVAAGEFRLGTVGRVKDSHASRFLNLMDRNADGRVTPRELRWMLGPMREDGGRTSPFLADRARLNLLV